jgi:hypothetical protein
MGISSWQPPDPLWRNSQTPWQKLLFEVKDIGGSLNALTMYALRWCFFAVSFLSLGDDEGAMVGVFHDDASSLLHPSQATGVSMRYVSIIGMF